jgi:hypothetical protein
MARFVITAVFEVGPGRVPLGRDVVGTAWGPGHEFSYCDGRMLTIVVEVPAPDPSHAFEIVLSHAGTVWETLVGEALPAPSILRLQHMIPEEKVVAGPVGRGPDRLFAEAAASRAAHLRAAVAAMTDLQRRGRRSRRPDAGPGWECDDSPGDGGLAGARAGSGGVVTALQLPPPFPLIEDLPAL